MNITVTGKIANVLAAKKGVSQSTGKEWMSQDFVIESEDGTMLCFNMFGEDKIKSSGIKVGAIASVTLKVESTEWNGKWFTKLSCVSAIVQGATQAAPVNQPRPADRVNQPSNNNGNSYDGLPF